MQLNTDYTSRHAPRRPRELHCMKRKGCGKKTRDALSLNVSAAQCLLGDMVQIFEGYGESFEIALAHVLLAVLIEHSLDTGTDDGEPVLWHLRKEMVLYLEIEVCHPPISEPMV